jgi:intergrase/recombinase
MATTIKEIISNLQKLIEKLEEKENYYEIFNLFFLSENIIDKEMFKFLLENMKPKTKIEILKKMINVNNQNYFDKNDASIILLNKAIFNKKLNDFIDKIEFLKED